MHTSQVLQATIDSLTILGFTGLAGLCAFIGLIVWAKIQGKAELQTWQIDQLYADRVNASLKKSNKNK